MNKTALVLAAAMASACSDPPEASAVYEFDLGDSVEMTSGGPCGSVIDRYGFRSKSGPKYRVAFISEADVSIIHLPEPSITPCNGGA